MRPPTPILITRTNLLAHPAVEAWGRLNPARIEPETVERLQQKNKSAIYRLVGVGPENSSVIAKRCEAATAQIERKIYEEILPGLPVSALHCFGTTEDQDAGFCWLFIEDAGSEPYSALLGEHRAAASRWLAVLHASAMNLPYAANLPSRGPGYYLEHLHQARNNIVTNLDNPALKNGDLALLKKVLVACVFLESHWNRFAELCQAMQPTLVHGDLKEKNIRVRQTDNGIAILPFDWEIAGWGVPAADLLKCPNLALYLIEAQSHGAGWNYKDLQRLAAVGTIFRLLAALHWESSRLEFEWVEWSVGRFQDYLARLNQALPGVGLK